MKIIIEINEAEVKGIKDYLREVADVENPQKKILKAKFRVLYPVIFRPLKVH